MGTAASDIRACLDSLDAMIEKANGLVPEFEALRKAEFQGPDIRDLANAISFPEVQELDLLCKEALEKHTTDYPEFAELARRWYVHESQGMDSPEELHTDLVRKRTVLKHALNHAVGAPAEKNQNTDSSKGREGRLPTLLGHIKFVPRGLGTVADIGGGIAVILAVSHWALGLF